MQKIIGNFLKEVQESAAAMDKAVGPEFGARFRKNLAKNMAQGLANLMAEQCEKKGVVGSEDWESLKRSLQRK
jgi:hypothetical protein